MAVACATAEASAAGEDIAIGSTSTSVTDFVNRGPECDGLYVLPPLLEACCRVIGRPFKFSTLHSRTLARGSPGQALHVDVGRDAAEWPLLGFILMVEDFRPDNGATRFVPGSHRRLDAPWDSIVDAAAEHPEQVEACGAAGSLPVFHSSTWHGHAANTSGAPRRSLQGAFVPREGRAATDFAARMRPKTRRRLEEARRHLREAVALMVEANRALAREDDPGGAVILEPFSVTA